MKSKLVIKKILIVVIAIGFVYTGFLHLKIVQHSKSEVTENVDYLIVLGARVKGIVPSLALKSRIEAAAEYLNENPKTIAIASGGQGPGEDITEAESIKRELIKRGIAEERIIMEAQSTDTYENIRFSKTKIPEELKKGALVTNEFHLFRAKMIARDNGLKLAGLPGKTPIQALVKSYTREYLALTKYYLVSVF